MKKIEVIKKKAAVDAKYLQSKLKEAEADALIRFAKFQKKSNELLHAVKMSKKKRMEIKEKLEQLKRADDSTWENASKDFVESIESLGDKNIFKTKKKEWFNSVRKIDKRRERRY